jgi:hypothetical protein
MNYDTSEIHKYYTHHRIPLVADVGLFSELYSVFKHVFNLQEFMLYFSVVNFKKNSG